MRSTENGADIDNRTYWTVCVQSAEHYFEQPNDVDVDGFNLLATDFFSNFSTPCI